MSKIKKVNRGDSITISASPNNEFSSFEQWQILKGDLSLPDKTQSSITITPTNNTDLRAIFKGTFHSVSIKGTIEADDTTKEEFYNSFTSNKAISILYPHNSRIFVPQFLLNLGITFRDNYYMLNRFYEIEKEDRMISMDGVDISSSSDLIVDKDISLVGLYEPSDNENMPPCSYCGADVVLVKKDIQGIGTDYWTLNSVTFVTKGEYLEFRTNLALVPLSGQQNYTDGGLFLASTNIVTDREFPVERASMHTIFFSCGTIKFSKPTSSIRITITHEDLVPVELDINDSPIDDPFVKDILEGRV